jgi:hypothetical protein
MAHEKCTPVVRFQLLDLTTHCALRSTQMVRGFADAPELRRGDE